MRSVAFAFGLALLIGVVVGVMLSYLAWWAILLIVLFAACLIAWGLVGLSKKDISEENIGMVYGKAGKEYESLGPNTFRRVINWLKTH